MKLTSSDLSSIREACQQIEDAVASMLSPEEITIKATMDSSTIGAPRLTITMTRSGFGEWEIEIEEASPAPTPRRTARKTAKATPGAPDGG